MKLKINLSSKEAFIAGVFSAIGQCLVSEIYRTYVDIDPTAGIRNKIKERKRKKQFDNILTQIDLKSEEPVIKQMNQRIKELA